MTPLRRRMTEDLILHNRSPKTIRLYINWVADFAQYFHTSPEQLGPEHVRSYLLHLVQERQVSWNVHRPRLALQFLYRVTLGRGSSKRSPAPIDVTAEIAEASQPCGSPGPARSISSAASRRTSRNSTPSGTWHLARRAGTSARSFGRCRAGGPEGRDRRAAAGVLRKESGMGIPPP